jgi:hypothetical protein
MSTHRKRRGRVAVPAPPPVRNGHILPPELLKEVLYAYGFPDYPAQRCVWGYWPVQVCRHWMHLAKEDSKLWSFVVINQETDLATIDDQTLSAWLKLSRGSPLTIRIEFAGICKDTCPFYENASEILMRHLLPQAHRWVELSATLPIGLAWKICRLLPRMIQLKIFFLLLLGHNGTPNTNLLGHPLSIWDRIPVAPHLPLLQDIDIGWCSISDIFGQDSIPSLRTLRFWGSPPTSEELSRFPVLYPALTELGFRHCKDWVGMPSQQGHPVFASLIRLSIACDSADPMAVSMWNCLLVGSPQLEDLLLHIPYPSDYLDSLLPLPQNLTYLSLGFKRGGGTNDDLILDEDQTMRWLAPLKGLQELSLIWFAKDEVHELSFNPFIRALSRINEAELFMCPRLHILILCQASIEQADLINLIKTRRLARQPLLVSLKKCFGFPDFVTSEEAELQRACAEVMTTLPFYPGESHALPKITDFY